MIKLGSKIATQFVYILKYFLRQINADFNSTFYQKQNTGSGYKHFGMHFIT